MVMEKRYFLNNSNSKWIAIGLKPISNVASIGFYTDIVIGGAKMSAVSLNGADGFATICSILRSMEEFKFAFPATAKCYDEINVTPVNITKKIFSGTMCFQIETPYGSAYLAMASVLEILKYEQLISAALNTTKSHEKEIEKKFNELLNKSGDDFSAAIDAAEKSGNLLAIELLINFNALLKLSIENNARKPPVGTSNNTIPTKRRGTTTNKQNVDLKKNKKTVEKGKNAANKGNSVVPNSASSDVAGASVAEASVAEAPVVPNATNAVAEAPVVPNPPVTVIDEDISVIELPGNDTDDDDLADDEDTLHDHNYGALAGESGQLITTQDYL